jgi:hypothetical protein
MPMPEIWEFGNWVAAALLLDEGEPKRCPELDLLKKLGG